MQDSGLTLYPVVESEKEVTAIIAEALKSFDTNVAGPNTFLKQYEPYLYILDGTAEKDVKGLFNIDPLPFLKVNCDFSSKLILPFIYPVIVNLSFGKLCRILLLK